MKRRNIYLDDADRQAYFDLSGRTVEKFGWLVYAIALMSNRFHLYFRTPEANLSRGGQFLLAGLRAAVQPPPPSERAFA